MNIAVVFSIAVVVICLSVSLLKAANEWYKKWLDSDRDPETGAPCAREPIGRSLLRALKAPRERRLREREEDLRRLESVPPEERTYNNPYGRDIVLALLTCVFPIACFLVVAFYALPKVRGTSIGQYGTIIAYIVLLLMGVMCCNGLLRLVAGIAGYYKYRDYKRKHPGKQFNRASFELEMKSINGGYHPSDFGK